MFLIVQVINEEIEQYWPHYQPLGYTTSDLPPMGLCATGHTPQGLAVKTVLSLPRCLFT